VLFASRKSINGCHSASPGTLCQVKKQRAWLAPPKFPCPVSLHSLAVRPSARLGPARPQVRRSGQQPIPARYGCAGRAEPRCRSATPSLLPNQAKHGARGTLSGGGTCFCHLQLRALGVVLPSVCLLSLFSLALAL